MAVKRSAPEGVRTTIERLWMAGLFLVEMEEVVKVEEDVLGRWRETGFATSSTDWIWTVSIVNFVRGHDEVKGEIFKRCCLRFRPCLPMSATSVMGCLLLHMIDRSYGLIHTHRLCLTAFAPPASPPDNGSGAKLKVLRLRTYFHIHSPTIVAVMASTILCCNMFGPDVGAMDVVVVRGIKSRDVEWAWVFGV